MPSLETIETISYRMDNSSPRIRRETEENILNMTDCTFDEILRIWHHLPEEMRLDPNLIVFKDGYEKSKNRLELDKAFVRDYSATNTDLECSSKNTDKSKGQLSNGNWSSLWIKLKVIIRYVKLILLISCWIGFFTILMTTKEDVPNSQLISVPYDNIKSVRLANSVNSSKISVSIEGPFATDAIMSTTSYHNQTHSSLSIWLESLEDQARFTYNPLMDNAEFSKNISEIWNVPLLSSERTNSYANERKIKTFNLLNPVTQPVAINLKTNSNVTIPFLISYDVTPMDLEKGLALGTTVLIGLYILIVFELVHRTLAALLAATSSIAILAALHEKPTTSQIISWIDIDTLMLLFSMMILVAIVGETGAFDYFAAFAYKITRGKVLPLVSIICFFTAFVSAFLDNVTVILLMTPVTIRLCEVIQLNPVPVLTLMVMFSNVGGAATPVGDPPNVIIATNRHVIAAGVGFSTFTIHMGVGVLLALVIVYGHFRFIFRNVESMRFVKPRQNADNELSFWQKAVTTLSTFDESDNLAGKTLLRNAKEVLRIRESKQILDCNSRDNYRIVLKELKEKYSIRDKWLLVKSGFCMVLVVTFFFMHSSPNFHLTIGSSTFLCVLLLLVLADDKDFDELLHCVEWSTLLFFAALFVLMEALSELGLISWIGNKTETIITSVNEESRLAVAILLLLWVSSIAGAFIDNVPLTTMMIRIVTELSENRKLQLPLQPLVWALAFGACMGGNGTLIGATTNVVCAGVAEQHGYRVTFLQFFKMGFPVLLTTTFTISVYLMVAHVIFEWNY